MENGMEKKNRTNISGKNNAVFGTIAATRSPGSACSARGGFCGNCVSCCSNIGR
jgi:hypothetical protein